MKKLITLVSASAVFSGFVLAGPVETPSSKMVAIPPPPPEYYGTGWYGAIQAGANVYQDAGGGFDFTSRNGNDISLDPDEDVGFFGGLKLGYVFGTGFVRPALEADMFYNGVQTGVNARVNGDTVGSTSTTIDSGAFMANTLLRFNYERFQPYVGFGLGYWVAQANDIEVNFNGVTEARVNSNTDGGVAWQIVAGADYYFNPKLSGFIEYKFLNYSDAIFDNTIAQQLVGLGVRFHF